MASSVFAGKAQIGGRYVTKGGWPVVVLGPKKWFGREGIEVREEQTRVVSTIPTDQLLWPYSPKLVKQENITMAKAHKTEAKKGGVAVREIVQLKDSTVLRRTFKGKEYTATVTDGGKVKYNGKVYEELKDAVAAIIGKKPYIGSGKWFFGLDEAWNKRHGVKVEKLKKAA